MQALVYWSCVNDHIVPDWAMPESGLKCNVVGCEEPRFEYEVLVSDLIGLSYKLVGKAMNFEGPDDDITPAGWDLFVTAADLEHELLKIVKEKVTDGRVSA